MTILLGALSLLAVLTQHPEKRRIERKEFGKNLSRSFRQFFLFLFPFFADRRENLRQILVRFLDRDNHIRLL